MKDRKKGRLVICAKGPSVYYGYWIDGKPVELYADARGRQSLMGNIYAARVENVADGIHGAFLEIGKGQKAYLPLPSGPGPAGSRDRKDSQSIKGGDIVLVQIRKDAIKSKLPVADRNIAFSGKYFVLTLVDHRYGISRKIREEKERDRLQSILDRFRTEDHGIIARTNAAGTEDRILLDELESLIRQKNDILTRGSCAAARTLVYEEPAYYITLGRELPEEELDQIITDDPEIYEELINYYSFHGDEELRDRIRLYTDEYPLDKLYRMEYFYGQASGKKVWLDSGGSLIIEPTEALTVIDVNSGSVVKNRKKEDDFFLRLNREAAGEIAAQLRLRNLSGIILIDFINMKDSAQEEMLLEELKRQCAGDRIPVRVIDITSLGLVELTRTKRRKTLKEQLRDAINVEK